ncbi:UDP-glucose/GDP-mannose dehydrogenase family, UDP binding domain [compost metagenome]
MEHLLELGVDEIRVIDPTITSLEQIHWTKELVDADKQRVNVFTKEEEAATGVHAVILTTTWSQFSTSPWEDWATKVESPYLFDGRNFLNPQEMHHYGWHYVGIARSVTQ